MSTPKDLRARKRMATRRDISVAASRLFRERGFDRVTIDEIAAAAEVGRMTVFNHFARKEDLFFDREDEGRGLAREALRAGGADPIETLRRLAHRLIAEGRTFLRFTPESREFVEAVEASAALRARAREIRDELATFIAGEIARAGGSAADDPGLQLTAGLVSATWAVAFSTAHRLYRERGDEREAVAVFLALIDRGSAAARAALSGSVPAQAGGASPGS